MAKRKTQNAAETPAAGPKVEAVLASVTVRGWSGQRTDEAISAEVAHAKGADPRAGRYVKNLIDPKALREVKSAGMFMRQLHYEMTRPWDDSGRRLLPGPLVEDYKTRMGVAAGLYMDAVDRLVAEYPALKERAKQDLGQMFEEDAYPEDWVLRTMFTAHFGFEPVPGREALPPSLKELGDKVEADTKAKLYEGQQALFHRVVHALQELARKLKHHDAKKEAGETTKLRSSLLEEVRSLARVLPALNVEGDPFLNDIANRLEKDLADLDPEKLRESQPERQKTIAAVEAMMAQMQGGPNQ